MPGLPRVVMACLNERGTHFSAPDDLQVCGGEGLRRLLGNLLRTSRTAHRGTCPVTLAIEADALILTIHDHVPSRRAGSDRIFDRFVRTGSSLPKAPVSASRSRGGSPVATAAS